MTKSGQYKGNNEPQIVGFVCNWGAYSGLEMAGMQKKEYPATV